MTPGAAGERAARRAQARADARHWAAHPAIVQLNRRLRNCPQDADGEALLAAAAPLLDDIAWVGDAVRSGVSRMAEDCWYEPPFRTLTPGHQRGIVLFDDGRLRITLARVLLEPMAQHKLAGERDAGARRSVSFTGLSTRTRVIRGGGALLQLWEAPAADGDFTAARAGRCRRTTTLPLADGDLFAIDGRREAWTFLRLRGDLLLLQASARGAAAPIAVEYDARSGAFLSASATDGTVARMQLLATLLRTMGRTDAAPAIAAAAAPDSPFFLRWHLLRELAALDRTAALPLLRDAAIGGGHPELAEAARQALALLAA